MDVKITGKRLKNTFSYDWVKLVAFAVAVIVLWSLLFTTCATRATDGQQFYFVIYDDVVYDTDEVSTLMSDMKKDGALSYDVLTSQYNNVTKAGNYAALYMLNLRLTTKEGDVMIVNAGKLKTQADESDEKTDDGDTTGDGENSSTEEKKDIDNILESGYGADLTAFIRGAGSYVKKFTKDGSESGEIDENKVTSYFMNTRVKSARNYKKTYTTDAKKEEGAKNEVIRIKNVQAAYLRVTAALKKAEEAGKEIIRYWDKPEYGKNNEVVGTQKTAYGIDLTVLAEGSANKRELVKDWWLVDENQNTTTEGLTFCVLNCTREDSDLQFESLTALDYIIRTYSNYAD